MAMSRINSSELEASSASFRLRVGYSLPMTGVTSKDSYASRAPLSFNGASFWDFAEALHSVPDVLVSVTVAIVIMKGYEF